MTIISHAVPTPVRVAMRQLLVIVRRAIDDEVASFIASRTSEAMRAMPDQDRHPSWPAANRRHGPTALLRRPAPAL